jgi:hypothetical protein
MDYPHGDKRVKRADYNRDMIIAAEDGHMDIVLFMITNGKLTKHARMV